MIKQDRLYSIILQISQIITGKVAFQMIILLFSPMFRSLQVF